MCEDKLPDCDVYGKAACKAPYLEWATQNCAKFCGLGDCKDMSTTTTGKQKNHPLTDSGLAYR